MLAIELLIVTAMAIVFGSTAVGTARSHLRTRVWTTRPTIVAVAGRPGAPTLRSPATARRSPPAVPAA